MESHFHNIIFLSLLIFGSIYGSEAVRNGTLALITPMQRPSLGDDACMVSTQQRNTSCCVCPGECGFTHPKDPVRTYSAGITLLSVSFDISGQEGKLDVHLYLCPRNNKTDPIYQNCLLKNPLRIVNRTEIGFRLKVMVEIPGNLTCRNCLLQWTSTKAVLPTGDVSTKQYYGCSDIAILSHDEFDYRSNSSLDVGSGTGDSQTSTQSTSVGSTRSPFRTSHGNPTQHRTTVSNCWAVGVYAKVDGLHEWCKTNCRQGFCPKTHCKCVSNSTTSPRSFTKESMTTDVPPAPKLACKAVGVQATVPGMDVWCQNNCMMGFCPKSHCSCTPIENATTTKRQLFCKATGPWSTDPSMHKWCTQNCNRNYCPAFRCKCSYDDDTLTTMSNQNISTTASTRISSRTSNSTIVSTTASDAKPSTDSPTTSTTTTPHPSDITTKKHLICRATGVWSKVPGMHNWCTINCRRNYCPPSHCICSPVPLTTLLNQSTKTDAVTFSSRRVNPTTFDQTESTTNATSSTPLIPPTQQSSNDQTTAPPQPPMYY